MNGSEPIDCHDAAERLYEFLDGELTADWEQSVKDHIDMCSRCFALFDFEKTFLQFLTVRKRTEGAPEDLKRKIFDQFLHSEDFSETE